MEKIKLELYTDYLICNNGFATATGLSAMLEEEISYLGTMYDFLIYEYLYL